ncbi:MAG: hypothetical protein FVQ81_18365 [Candidatus Glassbacteria bacterium]|nr:hypothetical protein [Candidatus Glassbacteria bacterium]
MVTGISPIIVARSTIAASTQGTTETDVIDFDLAVNQAVEIFGVKSIWNSPVQGDTTALTQALAQASLHIEEDAVDDPDMDADATDRDTEIIHMDALSHESGDDSGAAQGGIAVAFGVLATPIEHFPVPILSLVNLTHRLELDGTLDGANHSYLVYYRYVRLSDQELIGAFAKRR